MKGKVEAGKAKVVDWASAIPGAIGFSGGGASHRVWIEKTGAKRIMVASNPTEAGVLLNYYAGVIDGLPEAKPGAQRVKATLRERLAGAREQQARLRIDVDAVSTLGDPKASRAALTNRQHNFSTTLRALFDDVHKQRMLLGGQVPAYTTESGGMTKGTVTCVAAFAVETAKYKRAYPVREGEGGGDVPVGTQGPSRAAKDGTRTVRGLESPESRKSGQVGGYVFETEKATEATEQKAEFVTRSTGDASPDAHAEARLLAQVERMLSQDATWKSRVRTIEIHLSHSPCPACTGLLLDLHRRLNNDKLRLAVVQWGQVYKHPVYPTTPGDARSLRARYSVVGPFPT